VLLVAAVAYSLYIVFFGWFVHIILLISVFIFYVKSTTKKKQVTTKETNKTKTKQNKTKQKSNQKKQNKK